MPEYDKFADAYIQRIEDGKPYAAIELFSFFKVLGPVRGLTFWTSLAATAASLAC
jgi:hypothetical protein